MYVEYSFSIFFYQFHQFFFFLHERRQLKGKTETQEKAYHDSKLISTAQGGSPEAFVYKTKEPSILKTSKLFILVGRLRGALKVVTS